MHIGNTPTMGPLAAEVDRLLGDVDAGTCTPLAPAVLLATIMEWYDSGSKGGRTAFARRVRSAIGIARGLPF